MEHRVEGGRAGLWVLIACLVLASIAAAVVALSHVIGSSGGAAVEERDEPSDASPLAEPAVVEGAGDAADAADAGDAPLDVGRLLRDGRTAEITDALNALYRRVKTSRQELDALHPLLRSDYTGHVRAVLALHERLGEMSSRTEGALLEVWLSPSVAEDIREDALAVLMRSASGRDALRRACIERLHVPSADQRVRAVETLTKLGCRDAEFRAFVHETCLDSSAGRWERSACARALAVVGLPHDGRADGIVHNVMGEAPGSLESKWAVHSLVEMGFSSPIMAEVAGRFVDSADAIDVFTGLRLVESCVPRIDERLQRRLDAARRRHPELPAGFDALQEGR